MDLKLQTFVSGQYQLQLRKFYSKTVGTNIGYKIPPSVTKIVEDQKYKIVVPPFQKIYNFYFLKSQTNLSLTKSI
jgi:hypothetical protein